MERGRQGVTLGAAQSRLVAGAVVALSVLAQWAIHDRAIVPMDEGHLAAAASWMLQGKLLYRDIHTGLFPGIYLLTTGLFAIFGQDLLVTRIAAVVMNAAITLALFRIASRILGLGWALVPPLLHLMLIAMAFPVLTMFNYSTLSVCFGLLALLFLLRYFERGLLGDALLVGFWVACATITKQNFGALIFLALLIALLAFRSRSALEGRPLVAVLAPIAASGALLTLAVVSYFVATGTLFDLVDRTILSLGGSQIEDFNNPMPPILGPHPVDDVRFTFLYSPPSLFNYLVHGQALFGLVNITPGVRSLAIRVSYGLPLLALAAAALIAWFGRGRQVGGDSRWRATPVIVFYAIAFFPGIFPSAVWSHLAFVLIPALLLFAYIGERADWWLASRNSKLARGWRGLVIAALLAGALAAAQTQVDIARWNPVPLELERATLSVSQRQAGLFRGAHRFVQKCAPPGQPIFVAPDIPAVYFITARENPTRYDLTIPGAVDGPLIVARLEEMQTRCVVYNPAMYPEFPPFAELYPQLSEYLSAKYRRQVTIRGGASEWWGMVRRD